MTISALRTEAPPGDRRAARGLLDDAVAEARARGREDVGAALARDGARLLDPGARVLVVGDHKVGKSSLVNALLGQEACPVHPDVSTALPTVVTHSEVAFSVLVGPEGRTGVTAARLAEAVTGRDVGTQWHHAEIGRPATALADGLTLVDTPGAGGPGSPAAIMTRTEFPAADAVVLVSDAGAELSPTELDLLRAACEHVATVVVALSRIDLHPGWRAVRDRDVAVLASDGLPAAVVPVSPVLAREAAARCDPLLEIESGVPALRELLAERVVAPVGVCARRAVADAVEAARRRLRSVRGTERARLPVGELAAESARAIRRLRVLDDEIATLGAAVERDLTCRLHDVLVRTERALERIDPAAVGEQFAPWLIGEVGRAVAATHLWAGERTWWLADPDGDSPVRGILAGLREPYGGVLAVGLGETLTRVAPPTGGTTPPSRLRDQRGRALRRRQLDARRDARRYLAEVGTALLHHTEERLDEVRTRLGAGLENAPSADEGRGENVGERVYA